MPVGKAPAAPGFRPSGLNRHSLNRIAMSTGMAPGATWYRYSLALEAGLLIREVPQNAQIKCQRLVKHEGEAEGRGYVAAKNRRRYRRGPAFSSFANPCATPPSHFPTIIRFRSGYALLSLPQQMNWLTSSGLVGQVIAL